MFEKCRICPRNCNVNRKNGEKGYCKCDDKIKVALVSTHYFEEPCISGNVQSGENFKKCKGSGTIFFSNCNMNCIYCQNYEVSQYGRGKDITVSRLADIMIEQQERGVNNINLVTPTMYVYQIIDAIKIAKNKGLKIPIIYNTNSYENVSTIRALNGYIDVYLPDLKYFSDEIAIKYSKAPNYFETAKEAIKEMYNQVGKPIFTEDGLIKKGIIIRHLVLPNHVQNTKHILKWIKDTFDDNVYVSVMAQYFPTYKAKNDENLNRKISTKEYKIVENYIDMLELSNGYMQDLGKHEEEYVPKFDLRNV